MKVILKVISTISCILIVFCLFNTTPAFADNDEDTANTVSTNIIGDIQDDGEGCGFYMILNLVIQILTYGIIIAAAVGITITGITYITAKGNEAQVTKAKRRLIETIVGLVVYVILWAIINFILPGGILNGSTQCKSVTNAPGLFDTDPIMTERQIKSSGNVSKSSNSKKKICKAPSNCSWGERIAQTAELLAWPEKTPRRKYYKTMYGRNKCFTKWSQMTKGRPTKAFQIAFDKVYPSHWKDCKRKAAEWGSGPYLGASCDKFAGTVVKYSGYDKNIGLTLGAQTPHLENSKKWKRHSKPKRGDFCNRNGHSSIYLGKGKVAQAHYSSQSVGGKSFGHIEKDNCSGMRIYRAE